MTAPDAPAERPALHGSVAEIAADPNDPTGPVVIMRFKTGAAEFSLKIDARQAPQFMLGLSQGVVAAAQQALAAAGPQIITPGSPLYVPPPNGHQFGGLQ